MSSEEWDDEDEDDFDPTLEVVRLDKRRICFWCGQYIKCGATCWANEFKHEGEVYINYEHFVCHDIANRQDRMLHGMKSSYAEEAYLEECHEPWDFWEEKLKLPLIDLEKLP